jgi:flagellar protein FliT
MQMDSQELISIYENVAVITDQMLAAARVGDWEQLIELESRCASQVDILRTEEPRTALSGSVRERKVALIKKVLEDDRQIRSITEPWMEQLSMLINSVSTERKLSSTYGAGRTG